ncbi:MAG: DNA polymerase III subunit delta' [Nitrospirota bacterium]
MALRDVIGQEKAVNILLKTIKRGRIPSSYLFAGESGIGKKFTALNLAKALNCLNPPSPPFSKGGTGGFDSCDECPSCKKIEARVHPDLLIILPEGGQIRIEEIRAVDDMLSFKPFEGRYKVVLIDEADTMNIYAANAFLKTLEEPPKESLIILISSKPDRLPDTIRSRCSKVNFTPLSFEACKKVIETVISYQSEVRSQKSKKDSGFSTFDSRLSTIVRLSMGRPGLAISGDLIEEREWFMKLLGLILASEKDGWTTKEEMERWFNLIIILLRDMAILKITKDEKSLVNIDLKDYIKKFSNSMDLKVIIKSYERLNTLRGYLNYNLNKSLTWNYTGSLLRKMIEGVYA